MFFGDDAVGLNTLLFDFIIEVYRMGEVKEKRCLVRCKVCGWENYVDAGECEEKRFLFLKCENCGAKDVYLRPSRRFEKPITITGSFLGRFLYTFLTFWVNFKNMVFNFGGLVLSKVLSIRDLSRSRLYILASMVIGVVLVVFGWFVMRRFLVHLVLAAVSLISGIVSWSLSGEE